MRTLRFRLAIVLFMVAAVPICQAAEKGPTRELPNTAEGAVGLPPASRFLGPIRRDANGNLVPILPTDEHLSEGTHASGLVALGDISRLRRLQDRREYARRATLAQGRIDHIVKRELIARKNGARLNERGLTNGENRLLDKLEENHRKLLTKVRMQYLAALPYVRPPEFWYVTGPGNRRFAIAGLAQFDLLAVGGNLDASIAKLLTLKAAALTSDEPTKRDLDIAAELDRLIGVLRRK